MRRSAAQAGVAAVFVTACELATDARPALTLVHRSAYLMGTRVHGNLRRSEHRGPIAFAQAKAITLS